MGMGNPMISVMPPKLVTLKSVSPSVLVPSIYAYWKLNLGNSECNTVARVTGYINTPLHAPCNPNCTAYCTLASESIQYVTGLFADRERIIQSCQLKFILYLPTNAFCGLRKNYFTVLLQIRHLPKRQLSGQL